MTTKTEHSTEWECTFGCGIKLTEGHISERIRNAHTLRKEATYAVPVDRFPPRPLPRP